MNVREHSIRTAGGAESPSAEGSALAGFTLLELILSVGITAIVLIAINAVFFSAIRLREHAAAAVEEGLPIQHTFATLRRDLQGAMSPSGNGILSGSFKVGGVSSAGIGQAVDLEVYTTTGAFRENDPWGEVQKVAYQLRPPADRQQPGQDLFRCVTRNLLSVMTPQPEEQLMMNGVDHIEFSCYDGSSWINSWDSTITTNLPIAVRARVLLANAANNTGTPRPVEILVPILSQTRTNY